MWANDRPDAGFDREQAGTSDDATVDLVDPYGRAGYELAAGVWQLEIYVDGSTRAQLTFTIDEVAG